MIEPGSVLASYLETLRQLSGAEAVTLFLAAPGREKGAGLLVHAGAGHPVPELADAASAASFVRRHQRKLQRAGAQVAGGALQVASAEPNCRLLLLPSIETQLGRPPVKGGRRRRRSDRLARAPLSHAWIGMRFHREPAELPPIGEPFPLSLEPPAASRDPSSWGWILALGGAMVWTAHLATESLRDPVSGLASRLELQATLERLVESARSGRRPLTLVLVNPDGFASVNDHLGRETGDRVIREIADRLRALHRGSDFIARYGGAVFAAALVDTPLEDGRKVAEKVRRQLSRTALLDGRLTLPFTAGMAALTDAQPSSLEAATELLRLADAALGVGKRDGGDRLVAWDEGIRASETESHDRLRGIFTADVARDYRNMALLLDTLRSVATAEDVSSLVGEAVARIAATFRPSRAGMFRSAGGGAFGLLHGVGLGSGAVEALGPEGWNLSGEQAALAADAMARGGPQSVPATPTGGPGMTCVVPMLVGAEPVGCLVLEYTDGGGCDSHDLHFLRVLAGQLGVALDRAELAAVERERRWRETEQMRIELENLRTALDSSQLLYRSAQMEELLALARRVAPTDATVLITGESGTGKEILARTIHDLSPRRDGPRVVVDCTSIPDTLVESELFGHEKGAFTGADRSKRGRLLEADGGTVFLDEIAELPMAVQSRLLRFVQEHQFTPVGSERLLSVDVRIVAATNRDLAAEAQAGRFREDLFHRLNVFRLEVPPLRERPDDVLYLARHFLSRYSLAYGKPLDSISPAAEQALRSYPWPGNVRELQHCIMRAVILCDERSLDRHHLVFLDQPMGQAQVGGAGASFRPSSGVGGAVPPAAGGLQGSRDWQGVAEALRGLAVAAQASPGGPPPVGLHLQHELLLQAHAQAGGVGRQAAWLLGISETTYRRRLAKARAQAGSIPARLRGPWADLSAAVRLLLRSPHAGGVDLMKAAERGLLEALREAGVERVAVGAALLGVSPHTYRKRLGELADT